MKTWRLTLTSIVDCLLILISLPLLFTVCGLSIMAFDAPGSESMWLPWFLFFGVIGISIILVLVAIIGAVRMLRAKRLFLSLLFSALPLIVIGVSFVIINLT